MGLTISQEVYLEHYGVKGMKWGVRKDRTTSSSSRERRKPRNLIKERRRAKLNARSDERKDLDKLRKTKKVYEMTDAELKRAIGRMSLEKRYKELELESFYPHFSIAKKVVQRKETKVMQEMLDDVYGRVRK